MEKSVIYDNILPFLRVGTYNIPFIKINNPRLRV